MSGKEDEGGGGGKTSEPVNEGKTSPTRDNGSSAGGGGAGTEEGSNASIRRLAPQVSLKFPVHGVLHSEISTRESGLLKELPQAHS